MVMQDGFARKKLLKSSSFEYQVAFFLVQMCVCVYYREKSQGGISKSQQPFSPYHQDVNHVEGSLVLSVCLRHARDWEDRATRSPGRQMVWRETTLL